MKPSAARPLSASLRLALASVLATASLLGLSCAPQARPPEAAERAPRPTPGRTPSRPSALRGVPRAADAPPRPTGPTLAVLSSEASFRVSSWIGRWETTAGADVLRRMGLRVRLISDADLEAGRVDGVRVLVVPNARCMSREAVARAERFVAGGGRLLATEMSAYRDEHNRRVGSANDFQWSSLIGAEFHRWLSGAPSCEFLALDPSLASEVAAILRRRAPLDRVQLGRNTAMLVTARPGAAVLATWLDADGRTPSADSGSTSAAVVQGAAGRAIYVGENLLAPELSRSREVEGLLLALLRRLDDDAASTLPSHLPAALEQAAPPFRFPHGPDVAIPVAGDMVGVGVREVSDAMGVSAASGLQVTPLDAAGAMTASPGQVLQIRLVAPLLSRPYVAVYDERHLLGRASEGVTVAAGRRADAVQFLDLRPNGTCKAQAFRGALEVRLRGPRLGVVNVLSAEEYVAGVVPNEMPGGYPTEAIKAMAVIARTFGLSRHGYHHADGYDVCATVHCQMYGGMLTEWESTDRAVAETAGRVIRSGDALADSTFHAVCGGVGENVERVWPQAPSPYLVGHSDGPSAVGDLSDEATFRAFIDRPPDAWCAHSPRFRWTETYTLAQLQALFQKSLPVTLKSSYHGLGQLRSLRVASRSPFGRVQTLEVAGTEGTYRVEKDRIRWLWSGGVVGQGGLQSTLFYLQTDPADPQRVVFHGGGWGHGVGMCQDGAAGMARKYDYAAIIAHYYPNTRLGVSPAALSTPGGFR